MNKEDFLNHVNSSSSNLRFESYLRILDRLLIWNMCAALLPKEGINKILNFWEKAVKKSIDAECNDRTTLLHESPLGRLASFKNEPDGELHRLTLLKELDIAKFVVTSNLKQEQAGEDENNDSTNELF